MFESSPGSCLFIRVIQAGSDSGGQYPVRPAFDLVIKATAAPDVDAEASVITLADVLPYRLWVVALQRRGAELIG